MITIPAAASSDTLVNPYAPTSPAPQDAGDFGGQLDQLVGAPANPYLPVSAAPTAPVAPGPVPATPAPVASPAPASPTQPTTPVSPGSLPSAPANPAPATATGTWRDYVFGRSTSNNYAGVMVAPTRVIESGYAAGAFRHQLEGFNPAKFDPAHGEGMTLKMIAARVFEQFDVYGETAIDDVVAAFNELGIPATKVGLDQIDFDNGEGPIDVIRNAAWLDGDKSAGMAWQWAPVFDGRQPMNFTMNGTAAPVPGVTGPGGVGGIDPGGPVGVVAAAAAGQDQIDLGRVSWLHADASQWAVTSRIKDVKIGANTISIDHTKAGQWPVFDFQGIAVEGNPWIFVQRNGTWHGATYDWLRPGQIEKSIRGDELGPHTKSAALADWRPQPGELVGFMVSTIARTADRTANERTNIALVPWPA
jgi:hypothetical protein